MRIDIILLFWLVGPNIHLRSHDRWEYSICGKIIGEGKLKSLVRENCLVSIHPPLPSYGLPWDGIWVSSEKPASCHKPWNRYAMNTCIKCNTTLPLMRSFNLSIATEILTGISGFGISALLLLILWRWCVTVLDENNNHVLHFLLDPNNSQSNILTSSSWAWRFCY